MTYNQSSNKTNNGVSLKKTPAIVSSSHLAEKEGWQISELEYSIIVAYNSFSRWVSHAMKSVENNSFNPLTILILHNINHRQRAKKISDITFMLNIEDTHTVSYAIKKLLAHNLVSSKKIGKEIYYSTTKLGQEICTKYRETRKNCLLRSIKSINLNYDEIREVADVLRIMSGLYDQASRSASSF